MTTTTIESHANPTHVAFFPNIPGARVEFDSKLGWGPVDALVKAYPNAGVPSVTPVDGAAVTIHTALGTSPAAVVTEPAAQPESEVERAKAIGVSDFSGGLIVDGAAKARIEAQHDALRATGIAVDAGKQLYATGTRMAEVGYENQAARAREHTERLPLRDAAEQLVERVRSEAREDVTFTARELAAKVQVNGRLTIAGMTLQEQAIRGLLSRVESPALSYVFGLRDRIANNLRAMKSDAAMLAPLTEAVTADKRELAHVLAHELHQAGDAQIKLRTRKLGDGRDAYAAVSTRYEPADAPEVLAQILRSLPTDAKGSYSYDPSTTTWELRAEVWTPTPVAEQAVGEPFRGFVSFRSRDNGTGSLKGGGGIEILACLNASTYVADSTEVNRRHIGTIVAEAEKMVARARMGIDTLCLAWGTARQDVLAVGGPALSKVESLRPEYEAAVGLCVSQAIPGFWWGTLADRKCELAGVLPGRTKDHVEGLSAAYFAQRRDTEQVVRADFGQAWTHYIQKQPAGVRRDAEAAGAAWMVGGRPVRFDADRVEG